MEVAQAAANRSCWDNFMEQRVEGVKGGAALHPFAAAIAQPPPRQCLATAASIPRTAASQAQLSDASAPVTKSQQSHRLGLNCVLLRLRVLSAGIDGIVRDGDHRTCSPPKPETTTL
ncbi:hypothetical protein B0H13DRAFT_1869909 [Mycena leptocephala]|nr:hypothetical protein B0H13DRAFT_1869909 [Mycena leptocephala]